MGYGEVWARGRNQRGVSDRQEWGTEKDEPQGGVDHRDE